MSSQKVYPTQPLADDSNRPSRNVTVVDSTPLILPTHSEVTKTTQQLDASSKPSGSYITANQVTTPKPERALQKAPLTQPSVDPLNPVAPPLVADLKYLTPAHPESKSTLDLTRSTPQKAESFLQNVLLTQGLSELPSQLTDDVVEQRPVHEVTRTESRKMAAQQSELPAALPPISVASNFAGARSTPTKVESSLQQLASPQFHHPDQLSSATLNNMSSAPPTYPETKAETQLLVRPLTPSETNIASNQTFAWATPPKPERSPRTSIQPSTDQPNQPPRNGPGATFIPQVHLDPKKMSNRQPDHPLAFSIAISASNQTIVRPKPLKAEDSLPKESPDLPTAEADRPPQKRAFVAPPHTQAKSSAPEVDTNVINPRLNQGLEFESEHKPGRLLRETPLGNTATDRQVNFASERTRAGKEEVMRDNKILPVKSSSGRDYHVLAEVKGEDKVDPRETHTNDPPDPNVLDVERISDVHFLTAAQAAEQIKSPQFRPLSQKPQEHEDMLFSTDIRNKIGSSISRPPTITPFLHTYTSGTVYPTPVTPTPMGLPDSLMTTDDGMKSPFVAGRQGKKVYLNYSPNSITRSANQSGSEATDISRGKHNLDSERQDDHVSRPVHGSGLSTQVTFAVSKSSTVAIEPSIQGVGDQFHAAPVQHNLGVAPLQVASGWSQMSESQSHVAPVTSKNSTISPNYSSGEGFSHTPQPAHQGPPGAQKSSMTPQIVPTSLTALKPQEFLAPNANFAGQRQVYGQTAISNSSVEPARPSFASKDYQKTALDPPASAYDPRGLGKVSQNLQRDKTKDAESQAKPLNSSVETVQLSLAPKDYQKTALDPPASAHDPRGPGKVSQNLQRDKTRDAESQVKPLNSGLETVQLSLAPKDYLKTVPDPHTSAQDPEVLGRVSQNLQRDKTKDAESQAKPHLADPLSSKLNHDLNPKPVQKAPSLHPSTSHPISHTTSNVPHRLQSNHASVQSPVANIHHPKLAEILSSPPPIHRSMTPAMVHDNGPRSTPSTLAPFPPVMDALSHTRSGSSPTASPNHAFTSKAGGSPVDRARNSPLVPRDATTPKHSPSRRQILDPPLNEQTPSQAAPHSTPTVMSNSLATATSLAKFAAPADSLLRDSSLPDVTSTSRDIPDSHSVATQSLPSKVVANASNVMAATSSRNNQKHTQVQAPAELATRLRPTVINDIHPTYFHHSPGRIPSAVVQANSNDQTTQRSQPNPGVPSASTTSSVHPQPDISSSQSTFSTLPSTGALRHKQSASLPSNMPTSSTYQSQAATRVYQTPQILGRNLSTAPYNSRELLPALESSNMPSSTTPQSQAATRVHQTPQVSGRNPSAAPYHSRELLPVSEPSNMVSAAPQSQAATRVHQTPQIPGRNLLTAPNHSRELLPRMASEPSNMPPSTAPQSQAATRVYQTSQTSGRNPSTAPYHSRELLPHMASEPSNMPPSAAAPQSQSATRVYQTSQTSGRNPSMAPYRSRELLPHATLEPSNMPPSATPQSQAATRVYQTAQTSGRNISTAPYHSRELLPRTASEETILMTPSSLAPSMLRPTVSRTSIAPSTISQQEARKKGKILDIFRPKEPQEPQPAYELWHPPSSSKAADRNKAPNFAENPTQTTPNVRMTASSSSRMNDPPPIIVPIATQPIQGRKSPNSKVFTPFRYLTSKRNRTMSSLSLEAQDGEAPSTVVGSPTASMRSQTPIQPPPLRDPMAATQEWRNREEAGVLTRAKRRRQRPGVVFDVKEEPSQDKQRPKRRTRRVTGDERTSRS